VVVFFNCLLSTSPLIAQTKTFVSSRNVSFRISTEQASYKVGESITLKYSAKNISNRTLFVPREWEATCPASPHLWTSFEDSSGARLGGGYGGDCSPIAQTIRERMNKEAVLLKPGEHLDGTFLLDTRLLKPGAYKVVATLTGWTKEKFSDTERSELAKMAGPFMMGQVSASIRVTLTPNTK